MLRLIGLALSIGLADSLNPSTIAPALYLAGGPHARRDVLQFTAAVFGVFLLGGAILVYGPGEAILSLVPKPGPTTRYVLETIAGAAMLVVGTVLWRRRGALQRRRLPEPSRGGRSAAILGATLALVEMPTAFPYFAVVAAIVGSGVGPGREAVLLVLYNACFVLPQLLILATLAFAGARAERILGRAREVLQRRWPVILAGFALAAGAFVAALGVTGLLGSGHGRVASFSRRVRHLISH